MANIDPNKYAKNKDINPESKLSVLFATLRMGLMLIGIVGLAYELFRDDGLFSKIMSKLFESGSTMLLIPVIIFAIWLLNRWFSSPNKSETKKSGDYPMYVMMAVGAYYLFKIITSGSL